MDESIRKDYTTLTLDQFTSLKNALKNIQHVANYADKTMSALKGENIKNIRDTIINEINQKPTKYKLGEKFKGFRAIKEGLINGIANLKSLDTLIYQMTGEDSTLHDVFVKNPIMAADKESHDLEEIRRNYENLMKSNYSKRERNNLSSKSRFSG